jgi:hypothetical protein
VADLLPRSAGRRAAAALAALLVAAVLAVTLAACGGGTTASTDPLVGYWVGGGQGAQMTMVEVRKAGDTYTVLSNPNRVAGDARKEGDSLVIDTHSVVMHLTPRSADTLELKFTGEMFKQPKTVELQRVDQRQYADAAVAYGLVALRRGLAMWKAGGGKTYPPAKEVAPDGVLAKMIAWPVNLFNAGKPMIPEASTGNFTYKRLDGGKSYSLKAYLSDGSTIGK